MEMAGAPGWRNLFNVTFDVKRGRKIRHRPQPITPPSRSSAHNRLCAHYLPHNAKDHFSDLEGRL
jgi:hypothetical protein